MSLFGTKTEKTEITKTEYSKEQLNAEQLKNGKIKFNNAIRPIMKSNDIIMRSPEVISAIRQAVIRLQIEEHQAFKGL